MRNPFPPLVSSFSGAAPGAAPDPPGQTKPLELGARVWPQPCWPQGQCSPQPQSPWESPHVPGTGWACRESRGGCQGPGAPALRGSQRRLPHTHQRENLCVPPLAAPSQLETLQAALAPGVGWAGTGPPTHVPPKPRSCSKAPLSCSKTSLCSTHIVLGHTGRRKILLAEGQGKLLRKAPLPAQDLQGTPKPHPQQHKG